MKLLIICIACEALVELFFRAAPLQGARALAIRITPFFRSATMGHLFECKYCTSVWVAMLGVFVYFEGWDIEFVRWLCYLLAIHRISNALHLPMSYLRDLQLDLRVQRNRRS